MTGQTMPQPGGTAARNHDFSGQQGYPMPELPGFIDLFLWIFSIGYEIICTFAALIFN
jgi:hypothetical protein